LKNYRIELIGLLLLCGIFMSRCGAGLDTLYTGLYANGEADVYVTAPTGLAIGWFELSYKNKTLTRKGAVSTAAVGSAVSLSLTSSGRALIAGFNYAAGSNLGYFARNTATGQLTFSSSILAGGINENILGVTTNSSRSSYVYVVAPSGANTKVTAVSVDETTQSLAALTSVSSGGAGPFAVGLSPGGQHLVTTLTASFGVVPVTGDLSGSLTPYATSYASDFAFHSNGNYLYWNNTATFQVAYGTYSSATGTVAFTGNLGSGNGVGQTAVAVDPQNDFMATLGTSVANVGNIELWRLNGGGVPTPTASPLPLPAITQPLLPTPNAPTDLAFDKSGRFLFAVDCNQKKLWAFELDHSAGTLTALSGSPYDASDLQCLRNVVVSDSREAD